ncbi:MAG: C45 family peptidase [Gammaproteobacteria bacterium]|nr:C45 family peptidase [Gammaproteobacteria bacterium]
MNLVFEAIDEPAAGAKWQATFEKHWAAYRAWFLAEGDAARPSYRQCVRELERHMPELMPTYERLVELAGGGDLAARFLSLYRPPPYLTGCSQAVWPEGDNRLLVRNYDYSVDLTEGVLLHTQWNGRRVLAMCDCLWGVLDGMNDAGLVVSLTFGGRKTVGDGFGIPLVLRYILEFCETTREAAKALARIPAHMAYNVTLLDRKGEFRTAYVSPDRRTVIRQFPVATNHQGRVEWLEHAHATATLERERFLFARLADPDETADSLLESFLEPPLFSRAYRKGYGTLYTAIYRPRAGTLELRWTNGAWRQSFDSFEEGRWPITYRDESDLSIASS